jgi:hypothetical protein
MRMLMGTLYGDTEIELRCRDGDIVNDCALEDRQMSDEGFNLFKGAWG